MDNEEKDTLPDMERLIEIINNWRQESNDRFDRLEVQMNQMQTQMNQMQTQINTQFLEVRRDISGLHSRIDRMEALTHESLTAAFHARADVRDLNELFKDWSVVVQKLQNQGEPLTS